jgi:hypothetical protein
LTVQLRTALLGAAAAGAALVLAAALVPELPPLALLGGDAVHYDAMAREPLEPVAPPPWAERIGVPLLVAALPGSIETGFLAVAVASMLAAAVLVGLIAHELGLSVRAQVASAALTAGSYVGVHALYNPYYVDPTAVAVVALALLLALRRRWLAFAAVVTAGVLVKEVAATLVVVPYLLERRPGRLLDARAARLALGLAVPVLVCFALVHALAPAAPPPGGADMRTAFADSGIFYRGFLTSAVNPLVSLFGLVLLLWPLGLRRAAGPLRRLHVWALLAAPVLVFGHWERTLAVFLPLALACAFLLLREARPPLFAAFVLGSFWITGVVSALTIGEGETAVATKLALLLPGAIVGVAALALHARDLVGGARVVTPARAPPVAPPR